MSWQGLWLLSGRKLGQYADQELLKALFQNKTPDLSLKYHWSKCMTSRVSRGNKEKKAKRKNSVKKETKQEKKNGTKKQKTASPGVEPGLSAHASNSLTTVPQWHAWYEKLILSYENNFSLP